MLVFLLFKKESESDYMLTKKVDIICKFAYAKPTYKNGNIRNVKGTNIAYVKPHIITINKIDYLMFDECEDIYINGYDKKIKFKDLLEYIKSN